MRQSHALRSLIVGLALIAGPLRAYAGNEAGLSLIDDIIIVTQGGEEGALNKVPWGESPLFGPVPGALPRRLQELSPSGENRSLVVSPSRARVPAFTGPSENLRLGDPERLTQTEPEEPETRRPRAPVPLGLPPPSFRPWEIPYREDPGPPEGLTLDMAIQRLLVASPKLRTDAMGVPMAQADLRTAGARNNPIGFYSASGIPYGNYSPQRPNEITHSIVLVQPIDASGKRRSRLEVARQARNVMEAQYQNAVRFEVDRLYEAYVDVLAARESVRFAEAGLRVFDRLIAALREEYQRGQRSGEDVLGLEIMRRSAELARDETRSDLLRAKQELATLLDLPPAQAACLELYGSILDRGPPPPPGPGPMHTLI
ncbi:MAG: TolC family protein, partial [Isosphaeraceae bacterium]|nr:TolC family protein [Isosphaeraceae bacterium]